MKRLILALMLLTAMPLSADPLRLSDLSDPAEARQWRFFTDGVMGGVSTGQAVFEDGHLKLTGDVSTANNGGFIQVRREALALPEGTEALRIRVKGNGQAYYLHLRTSATLLPWQYYQASFTAPRDWTEITLKLSDFRPSGRMLPGTPRAGAVRSVALVAYGRDHAARVSLSGLWAEMPR
ncbi:CIA30 family protein [Thetidibacter halocola]|uniref:CIA30 family protein n=1 Tax=Thetidibacter halocola TaxID=2827239 RepID=A0A8J8B8S7_9RHOB|nr:CIA30 family protein [Thetidibacter halocola]MBS0125089.1 CIA30 family protein [Thetidibacter halocola]